MNLKKILATVSLAITLPATAFAHGELWYDAASHLPQFKKIVVYPIQYLNEGFKIDSNEKSETYQVNDYFDKRFVRKLKIKTVPLGSSLKENKEIRTDEEKYKSLYQNFSSEQDRATTVTSVTAANGYIIPHIFLDKLEPHNSPAKTVTVQMKSWTEEEGGPNGNRTYDEKNWNVSHTIPAKDLILYHMGIDYNMYDREGKKIMTYRNAEHTYGNAGGAVGSTVTNAVQNIYGIDISGVVGAINNIFSGKKSKPLKPDEYKVELFKSIVDEFRKDYDDIQKNFKDNKKKTRVGKTIGFKGINLPQNVGSDEYSLKSVYFGMKDMAFEYTDANIDYDGSDNARYFVQGDINYYSLDRHWVEPHATTYNELLSLQENDWYDTHGNKHTRKIKKYQTKIVDHHGYWQYTATVKGTFSLIDDSGRVLVTHSATETDDKTADAYQHLMKDFYKKVSAVISPNKK